MHILIFYLSILCFIILGLYFVCICMCVRACARARARARFFRFAQYFNSNPKPVVKRQIAHDSYRRIVSVNTRNRNQGRAYVNPFNADPSKRDGTERGGEEMFCPRPCRDTNNRVSNSGFAAAAAALSRYYHYYKLMWRDVMGVRAVWMGIEQQVATKNWEWVRELSSARYTSICSSSFPILYAALSAVYPARPPRYKPSGF